ncbi:MAG: hypothetical protein IPI07_16830 [Flavobacteriales bacterium]|nr:hypothetical protein [Flavobacteriales bacterium]
MVRKLVLGLLGSLSLGTICVAQSILRTGTTLVVDSGTTISVPDGLTLSIEPARAGERWAHRLRAARDAR